MVTRPGGMCYTCVQANDLEVYPPTCKAFPQRIPKEIMFDGFDHTKPYPGDGGIRYAPKRRKGRAQREAAAGV